MFITYMSERMTALTREQIVLNSLPIPPRQGIYFLISDGEIVYIGQTRNLASRLGNHVNSKDFSGYYILPVDDPKSLDDLERAYITEFKPRLNKIRFWCGEPSSGEGTKFEKAMQRVKRGQSAYSAAISEGVSHTALYQSDEYRAWKNEKN